jgi:hypothetical protein
MRKYYKAIRIEFSEPLLEEDTEKILASYKHLNPQLFIFKEEYKLNGCKCEGEWLKNPYEKEGCNNYFKPYKDYCLYCKELAKE